MAIDEIATKQLPLSHFFCRLVVLAHAISEELAWETQNGAKRVGKIRQGFCDI